MAADSGVDIDLYAEEGDDIEHNISGQVIELSLEVILIVNISKFGLKFNIFSCLFQHDDGAVDLYDDVLTTSAAEQQAEDEALQGIVSVSVHLNTCFQYCSLACN